MKNLIKFLKNINEEDILDAGTDYEGNPVYLLKNGNCVSTLTVGNQDINDWND
jgi:hypothetical protein